MAAGPAVGGGGRRGGAQQSVGVLNLLTDLAFNLLIFFVVCASTEPEKGRPQEVPSVSESENENKVDQNIKVSITRDSVSVNGAKVSMDELLVTLKPLLAGKVSPNERIVIVNQDGDNPYSRWIKVWGIIEQAGGILTIQVEVEKTVNLR